ncbi:prepilin-type N-terminal cleavage/methylation domain-containing protein [Pygmaiobacter massiliensis]|uniref:prepilin-type N-terminal cleavage/methylation domain-containing protein n=1 Tax=Pygmaiobacter massiliensis TaxID=1917873 RepID=UPI000C7C7BE8|nr:prepilin-type N-terminal cleavage/methylation domain-containing protein [Pygmaiobacter massiliensis]
MNNKKGFTLAEILVALGLLVLVVFCFTPLMLASLKSVQVSGKKQQDRFEQKSALEEKLSDGINYNAMDTTDNVSAVFSQSGKPDVIGAAEGKYLQSKDNLSESMFESFIAKDNASLVLSPSSVPENCKTGLISGTQVTITTDFINFEDAGQFYLLVNGSTKYENNTKIKFTLSNDSPRQATMQILAADLLRMGNTYQICYGSSGVSAYLQVTPPSLIVVGAEGAYYGRNSEGVWKQGNNHLGNNQFNDVIWTGTQYVAAGEKGTWWYTEENASGANVWNQMELENSSNKATLYDLQISEQAGNALTATGTVPVTRLFVSFNRLFAQQMDSANAIDVKNNDYITYKAATNIAGRAVSDAYINGSTRFLWLYSNVPLWEPETYYSVSTPVDGKVSVDASDKKRIPASGIPKGLVWNGKTDENNEYIAVFDSGQIYSLHPGTSTESYLNAKWKQDVNENIPYRETGTDEPIYILTYPGDWYGDDVVIKTDTPPEFKWNKGELYVTWSEGQEPITINKSYVSDTSLTITTVTHYERNIAEIYGNLNSVAYGNETFVAVGDVALRSISSTWHSTKVATQSAPRNSNGQVLWEQSSRTTDPVLDSQQTSDSKPANIIYRDAAGVWKAAPKVSNGTLNKVEYIAGKFYAVGQKGTVLTSTDGVNWKNDTAKLGDELARDKPNLYGIAGWGEN